MIARGIAPQLAVCLVVAVLGGACGVRPGESGPAATAPAPSPSVATIASAAPSTSRAPAAVIPASASPSAPASPSPAGVAATPLPTRTLPHADPSLEALLPAMIGDVALVRMSAPGSSFAGGGDICSFVCPDEPRLMAESVGATLDDLTVAVAYADVGGRPTGYALVAFRVRGATGAALRAGRIGMFDSEPPYPFVAEKKVGSRTVTVAVRSWFPNDTQFLVVDDDALIVILQGTPENPTGSTDVPPAVATVVGALP